MRKIVILSGFILFFIVGAFAFSADSLLTQARILVNQDRIGEAALLYEKILAQDSANYESYAFLGNYHYLLGKSSLEKAETMFKGIAQPNRMQVARYQDELKRIYRADYEKADRYLLKALTIQKNDHLKKLVGTIQLFKEKIGLDDVGTRKMKGIK
ncbi:MAG: hypothetical protein PHS30_08900 [Bacteroidales bacterium]|nr:hypothetical protein [Bacteroidales bacterium]